MRDLSRKIFDINVAIHFCRGCVYTFPKKQKQASADVKRKQAFALHIV